MEYFIDVSHSSINKKGEELCGDNIEIVKVDNGIIIVLSDGLGSGVKANILATLTSKIAVTMLKEGASIDETIDTITNTLPECKVRNLAYSTFTIIKISNNGECYVVEYDNPPFFLYRKGCDYPVNKITRVVNGKKILESSFTLEIDDLFVAISDGAVHAGIGQFLNLGWQWENINEFLRNISRSKFANQVSTDLLSVCNELYDHKPGDDTTVLALKRQSARYLDLFIGPPGNPENDKTLVKEIKYSKGKIILSGGTTAKIVAREFNEKIIKAIDKIINHRGNIALKELEEYIDLSNRQLRRLFQNYLGYSPKKFCNIVRFFDLFKELMKNNGENLSSKAYEFGYCDQSHLNKEFKKFSNLFPTHEMMSLFYKTK